MGRFEDLDVIEQEDRNRQALNKRFGLGYQASLVLRVWTEIDGARSYPDLFEDDPSGERHQDGIVDQAEGTTSSIANTAETPTTPSGIIICRIPKRVNPEGRGRVDSAFEAFSGKL